MPFRTYIPPELQKAHPELNLHEIRSIVNVILKSKDTIMRKSRIFKVKLPGIGVLRSHGKKKPKSRNKLVKRDTQKKRKKAREKEFTKERLLW